RGGPAGSPKKSAKGIHRDRRSFMPLARTIHLAELLSVLVTRRDVRIRADLQRHVLANQATPEIGETGPGVLPPDRPSDSVKCLPTSMGTGRFRSSGLLRGRQHAGES